MGSELPAAPRRPTGTGVCSKGLCLRPAARREVGVWLGAGEVLRGARVLVLVSPCAGLGSSWLLVPCP